MSVNSIPFLGYGNSGLITSQGQYVIGVMGKQNMLLVGNDYNYSSSVYIYETNQPLFVC